MDTLYIYVNNKSTTIEIMLYFTFSHRSNHGCVNLRIVNYKVLNLSNFISYLMPLSSSSFKRFMNYSHCFMKINPNRTSSISRHEPSKSPFIQLYISSWAKDSHNLYDYDGSPGTRYQNETRQIHSNCKLYRHVNTLKTTLIFENTKKTIPMEQIYIASVKLNQDTNTFSIQSADVTGMQPHPYLRQEHPDLFRNGYVVLRDLQKDEGVEGYPLEIGHYIKLGRLQYLVIQKSDLKGTQTLKEFSHLQLNSEINVANLKPIHGSCKICLCEQSLEFDPLINPCGCKGTCGLVHAGCLRNWINSKVKCESREIAITYNFSKFQCEICKQPFPKIIKLANGINMEMITFNKPQKPYIVLESFTSKNQQGEKPKERNLHVVCPKEFASVKIGRGHQCQIRITDISVSRTHAEIRFQYGKFYLVDLKSKFGTLVKFREEFELRESFMLQCGRTCYSFSLADNNFSEEDMLEEISLDGQRLLEAWEPANGRQAYPGYDF